MSELTLVICKAANPESEGANSSFNQNTVWMSFNLLGCRIGLPYVWKIPDMSGIQVFCSEMICLSGNLIKCPEFL